MSRGSDLRARTSRAAAVRRSERTRFSSGSDHEQGGRKGAKPQRVVASGQILREQLATQLRRNKLRRFSRTPDGSADNIIGVLSCLRIGRSQLKAACISNTRHSLVAPLRVARGVLATPVSACPRPSPYAVPRIDGASRYELLRLSEIVRIAGEKLL